MMNILKLSLMSIHDCTCVFMVTLLLERVSLAFVYHQLNIRLISYLQTEGVRKVRICNVYSLSHPPSLSLSLIQGGPEHELLDGR